MLVRTITIAAAVLALSAVSAGAEEEKKGPPFGVRKKPPPPKPKTRTWAVKQDGARKFIYEFDFEPGIPKPKQTTEIMISANEIPKTPHPRFGSEVPLRDAHIVIELSNPAGELVGRYLAHAIPLARGKYGLHVTPGLEGIYSVSLRGETSDGANLDVEVKLPVDVWPLPEELQGQGAARKQKRGRRRPITSK